MHASELRTPCYVVDEQKLEENLKILRGVSDEAGAKILLAQKAFSMFAAYPLISRYLDGTAASGLFEARLGKEEMGGETHIYAAAYREDEFPEIAGICDHIVFNSIAQFQKFREAAGETALGLRINPEHSTQKHALYDPCAKHSRLGVTKEQLEGKRLEGLSGLHFHTLCEQNADALEETLDAVEEKFGDILTEMRWMNFGGGHHITRPDYDIPRLVNCIRRIRERYGLTVYLEPGEAVALNAGVLITTVLDIVRNGMDIAVVDASAACHMPDVLEVPYRPTISEAGRPGEKPHTYRIAGPTCLAGDIVGDYSFDQALQAGDQLVLGDMAIYTMVKNNTFNGMRLPDIVLRSASGDCRVVKSFGYEDFKGRLS
jgi:carboxynorspermidine decarboxylase